MSDPKYNVYAGELRFDDDNIVDVNLEPDTENITVRLNGEEITGGSDLPEVDSGDNGKVLTVVSGEWAAANPATPPAELPAVTSSDNGDVLTVVNGAWAKKGKTEYSIISPDNFSDLLPTPPSGYEWELLTEYTLSADGENPLTIAQLQAIDISNSLIRTESEVCVPTVLCSYNDYDDTDPQVGMKILIGVAITELDRGEVQTNMYGIFVSLRQGED